jgi:hypothetical protein
MVPMVQIVQQAPKSPAKGANTYTGANNAGAALGNPTTLLTGGSDSIDTSKLALARNTLLGL